MTLNERQKEIMKELEGKISDQSPIGAALMEMRSGEEKDVETPAGTIHIQVLEVSRTQG